MGAVAMEEEEHGRGIVLETFCGNTFGGGGSCVPCPKVDVPGGGGGTEEYPV